MFELVYTKSISWGLPYSVVYDHRIKIGLLPRGKWRVHGTDQLVLIGPSLLEVSVWGPFFSTKNEGNNYYHRIQNRKPRKKTSSIIVGLFCYFLYWKCMGEEICRIGDEVNKMFVISNNFRIFFFGFIQKSNYLYKMCMPFFFEEDKMCVLE